MSSYKRSRPNELNDIAAMELDSSPSSPKRRQIGVLNCRESMDCDSSSSSSSSSTSQTKASLVDSKTQNIVKSRSSRNDENEAPSNVPSSLQKSKNDLEEEEEKVSKAHKTLGDELLQTMISLESNNREFTPEAKFLKFRKDIVEWLTDICKEMRCRRVTLFTAVRFLDRILQSTKVAKDNLQLVAICSFLVAVKYEGPEEIVPSLSEASFLTQSQYDADVIREVEVHILNRLKWDLTEYTSFHFLQHFLGNTLSELGTKRKNRYVKKLTYQLASACLKTYAFEKYRPSLLAASLLTYGRKRAKMMPFCPSVLIESCKASKGEINQCVSHIESFIDTSNRNSDSCATPFILMPFDDREDTNSPRAVMELWSEDTRMM